MWDIVSSPYTWLLFVLCVAGITYAKRCFLDGLILGWFAPIILSAFWYLALFVFALGISLLELIVPKTVVLLESFLSSLPPEVVFLIHPSTAITTFLFVLYCRIERNNSFSSSSYGSSRPTGYARLPTVRHFRGS